MDWPPRSRCWTALGLFALATIAARPVVARADDEPGFTTPRDPSAELVEYQAPAAPAPAPAPAAAPAPAPAATPPTAAARASAAPVAPAPRPADTSTAAALQGAYNRGAAAASDLAGSNVQGRTVEMLGDDFSTAALRIIAARTPPIPNPPPRPSRSPTPRPVRTAGATATAMAGPAGA